MTVEFGLGMFVYNMICFITIALIIYFVINKIK